MDIDMHMDRCMDMRIACVNVCTKEWLIQLPRHSSGGTFVVGTIRRNLCCRHNPAEPLPSAQSGGTFAVGTIRRVQQTIRSVGENGRLAQSGLNTQGRQCRLTSYNGAITSFSSCVPCTHWGYRGSPPFCRSPSESFHH